MLKERVLKQFGKLEENREVLINFLDKSNGESMKFRPSPEKWNTLQIIFHLINAERNSVVYISKKKLGGTSVPKATWFNSLKSSWLTFSLLFLKTKAPKVLSEPPPELDYLQLKEEWNSVRIKMRELLIELPEDMLSRTIFRQPFAGYLNMPQALRFMQDHFKHHRKQIIQRIKMSA